MKIRKLTLVSNNVCYSPAPQPGQEVIQQLIINSKGGVWFTGYDFGMYGKGNAVRRKRISIGQDAAKHIFDAMEFFRNGKYAEDFVTDVGNWDLTITDEDGKSQCWTGPLISDSVRDAERKPYNVDSVLKANVAIEHLFGFSGDPDEDY